MGEHQIICILSFEYLMISNIRHQLLEFYIGLIGDN